MYFLSSQPSVDADVDLAVLAALPHSMQLDILAQVRFYIYYGWLDNTLNDKQ